MAKFANLPAELRFNIYDLCLTSRVIRYEYQTIYHTPTYQCPPRPALAKTAAVLPPIALVCRDTYHYLRPQYKLYHATWMQIEEHGPWKEPGQMRWRTTPVLFNRARDILYVNPDLHAFLVESERYHEYLRPARDALDALAADPRVRIAVDLWPLRSYTMGTHTSWPQLAARWRTVLALVLARKHCHIVATAASYTAASRRAIAGSGLFGAWGEQDHVFVDLLDGEARARYDADASGLVQQRGWRFARPCDHLRMERIEQFSTEPGVDAIVRALHGIKEMWLQHNNCFTRRDDDDFVENVLSQFEPGAQTGRYHMWDDTNPVALKFLAMLPEFSFSELVSAEVSDEN